MALEHLPSPRPRHLRVCPWPPIPCKHSPNSTRGNSTPPPTLPGAGPVLGAASHIHLNPRTILAERVNCGSSSETSRAPHSVQWQWARPPEPCTTGALGCPSPQLLEGPPALEASSAHLPCSKPSQRSLSSRSPSRWTPCGVRQAPTSPAQVGHSAQDPTTQVLLPPRACTPALLPAPKPGLCLVPCSGHREHRAPAMGAAGS